MADRSSTAQAPTGNIARSQLRTYAIIVGLFLGLLMVALATSWAAIDVVNATRAYATGEGRYSKAQKMAVLDLHRYATSHDGADYAAFQRDIAVPLADHAGRLALERAQPDIDEAGRHFLRGENHPDDIAGLIRLFQWFSWWKPFAQAIGDWRIADDQIAMLIARAGQLHRLVETRALDGAAEAAAVNDIDRLDSEITARENTFSTHMGEAARGATMVVVMGLGLSTIALWTIGILFAMRLFRRQVAVDRQLAQSEARFRDYADIASDWYWEMNPENRINYMSERIYDIMNIPMGTVINFDGIQMIRDAAIDPVHAEECIAAMAERRPFRYLRMRFLAKDGGVGYATISGKPAYDIDGHFVGYRGMGEDITTQMYDALKVRDAKARAERANKAKSEFLANMSHELRTPLNAILGFSDVIANRMFGEHQTARYADYARDIHNSGAHLLGVINDILDLSKIEAGHMTLEDGAIALDDAVYEVRTLLGDQASGTRVAFHLDTPRPSPVLKVDARKFEQILLNLLSNAFKFTPDGGSVTLSARYAIDGGLDVSVSDTGIGIAADDIETVLSPFGQVESAFSRRHHGTGLGLPLAKSLAEMHGGGLSLESTEGKGTTVTIHLPPERIGAQAVQAAAS
jgi:two-component system cell cycle sensor histidine kinase PleC